MANERPIHVRYVVKSGERILSLYTNLADPVNIYNNVHIEIETWVDNGFLAPTELLDVRYLSLKEAVEELNHGSKNQTR